MSTKADDIRAILSKVRMAKPYEVWFGVRRAKVYGIATIEFPSWLSDLWLMDGHWKDLSARFISMENFIKELEGILSLVEE